MGVLVWRDYFAPKKDRASVDMSNRAHLLHFTKIWREIEAWFDFENNNGIIILTKMSVTNLSVLLGGRYVLFSSKGNQVATRSF